MKLKSLSLFLVLSVFALGGNVDAQERAPAAPTPTAPASETGILAVGFSPVPILQKACKLIGTASDIKECADACVQGTSTLGQLSCCLKALEIQKPTLYKSVSTVLSGACEVCSCKVKALATCSVYDAKKPTSANLMNRVCGWICCTIDSTTVAHCTKECQKMSCDADYTPICGLSSAAGESAKAGGTW